MIRTSFDFCAALLGATVLYVIGDVLACAGIRRDSHALHRAGCLLVALGFAGLAALGVLLVQIARGGG